MASRRFCHLNIAVRRTAVAITAYYAVLVVVLTAISVYNFVLLLWRLPREGTDAARAWVLGDIREVAATILRL